MHWAAGVGRRAHLPGGWRAWAMFGLAGGALGLSVALAPSQVAAPAPEPGSTSFRR
jgi:hypothetical protein